MPFAIAPIMIRGISAALFLSIVVAVGRADFELTSSTGAVLKEVNDTTYLECAVSERWQTCIWSRDFDSEQFVIRDERGSARLLLKVLPGKAADSSLRRAESLLFLC